MTLEGVIGLTLGGLDIQRPDLDVFLALDEGLDGLPAMRGGSDLIPFRHGRLPTPRFADQRNPVLNGWVTGSATASMRAEFRAYVDALKAVLDPTRQETLPLVATLEDASTRWLNVRVSDLLWGETIASGARLVSVELEALDPYWYGPNGYASLDSGWFLDDGHYLDEGAELVIVPTSVAHLVPLDVPGTADIERVRIRFTGPSVSAVGVDVDGVGFVMAAPLAAGVMGADPEGLTVDNYRRTALDEWGVSVRAGMTLLPGNLHGEYIRIRPGARTLRILGQPAEVRFLLTPTYQ